MTMADIEEKICGFITADKKTVPLKAIDVSIKIIGTVAEVESSLTYYNEENDPIEATFTFPMDDGSAVYRFEAEIDGRTLRAEIQEKEQAKQTYEDSLKEGKTAALLQQDDKSADIFKCSLGNLPACSEAKLLLTYVIELPQEADGRLRFTLPTILNPRYSPEAGGEVPADGATYVHASSVPYKFSMSAHVTGYHKVMAVTSDSCQLNVQYEENNKVAEVTLAEEFKFDHDLCLLVQYEDCFTPQIVMEMGQSDADGLFKEDMLMLSFYPDLKEISMATSGEYIFVIDRSGSMRGQKITDAKEALLLFLKSLPADCYFNVISFGNDYKCLFKGGSKKYSEDSLQDAINLQTKMQADMGGTEILNPLQTVFKQSPIKGHRRYIFVLTDGQVSNTDQIIGLVKKYAASTRTFSLGIGRGASTALVNGIARAGNGKAEFIADGSRVQPKVISLLRCSMQSAITEVQVDWDLPPGVTPMLIPAELPCIVTAGERLTLYAIMQGVDQHTIYSASSVTLKGQMEGQQVSYTLTFTLADDNKSFSKTSPAHRLATKVQVKILEDQEDEQEHYYNYNHHNEVKDIRERLISLSRHANIISKMTSFVVVDNEGNKVQGNMVERPCPVPSLSMYEGYDTLRCLKASGFSGGSMMENSPLMSCGLYDDSSSPRRAKKGISGFGFGKLFSCTKKRKKSSSKSKNKYSAPPPPPINVDIEDAASSEEDAEEMAESTIEIEELKKVESSKSPNDQNLLSVIKEQKLQGSWELTQQMADLLKMSMDQIQSAVSLKDDRTVCTVVVVAWMRKFFLKRRNEWHLIETKAMTWLESQDLQGKTAQELLQTCTNNLWP